MPWMAFLSRQFVICFLVLYKAGQQRGSFLLTSSWIPLYFPLNLHCYFSNRVLFLEIKTKKITRIVEGPLGVSLANISKGVPSSCHSGIGLLIQGHQVEHSQAMLAIRVLIIGLQSNRVVSISSLSVSSSHFPHHPFSSLLNHVPYLPSLLSCHLCYATSTLLRGPPTLMTFFQFPTSTGIPIIYKNLKS